MVNIAEFEYCQSATVSVGRSVQSVDSLHSSISASDTPSNVECSGGYLYVFLEGQSLVKTRSGSATLAVGYGHLVW